ncbi:MAG: adenylate/guanylate cyclase domain-containing protein [Bacteroidia bacterium]|nr:adenylate/guanylate cyclase domain-containing protein [Bacteroidia bacterium]
MPKSRRLAAIMFTDIVGYTAMMQQDESKAVVSLNRHQSVLEEEVKIKQGEVLQYYGDGSLSIFNSASAAASCAMQIQEKLKQEPSVPLRIGLHVGEIFFEGGKVVGDGVNVASRIESMGIAGTILLSHEIYSKIRNQPEFKLLSLGSFEFKNVEEAVSVFAVANKGFPVPKRSELTGKFKTGKSPSHDKKGHFLLSYTFLISLLISSILLGGFMGWFIQPDTRRIVEKPLRRTTISLPEKASLALIGSVHHSIGQRAFDISADGKIIVYVAQTPDGTQLGLRPLNSYETQLIPGTEGAYFPFFSTDGDWVGFYANEKLYKVALSGTQPVAITDVTDPYSGIWLENDEIVFVDYEGQQLVRISAHEEQAQKLIIPAKLNTSPFSANKLWLASLPDPNHILLSNGANEIYAINLTSGKSTPVLSGGSSPSYLTSGHLIFAQWGRLMAARFDPDQLSLIGSPIPVIEGVRTESVRNGAQYAVSREGDLLYVSGSSVDKGSFVYINRQGEEVGNLALPANHYLPFILAQDQNLLLYQFQKSFFSEVHEIWIYDLERQIPSFLTKTKFHTILSPQAKSISYSIEMGSHWAIIDQTLDGTKLDTLIKKDNYVFPSSWSSDKKYIAFENEDVNGNSMLDLWALNVSDPQAKPFLISNSPKNQFFLDFSPNGEYVVYESDESEGTSEIYVQSFPRNNQKIKISNDGGSEPLWVSHGNEILFRSADFNQMISVAIDWTNGFHPASPRVLWEGEYLDISGRSFQVTDDGELFLMKKSVETKHTRSELLLVENWMEELNQLFPEKEK